MIFKNLTALCRQHKRIYLFGNPEGLQWATEGGALYPLQGMPGMTGNELAQVFDVPEKDLDKYRIKQEETLPGGYCYLDEDEGELQLRPEPWILKRYDQLLVPVRTSRGLRFYNPEYLKPLKDMQNTLEIYERSTESGELYFAVKSGWMLQAIILPIAPEYGKLLDELLTLCQALQQTVELTGTRAAEDVGPYEGEAREIEGQMEMEDKA